MVCRSILRCLAVGSGDDVLTTNRSSASPNNECGNTGNTRVRLEYLNLVAAKYGRADDEIPTPVRAAPQPA